MRFSLVAVAIAFAPLMSSARPLDPVDSLLSRRTPLGLINGNKQIAFSGAPPSGDGILQWLRGAFGGT